MLAAIALAAMVGAQPAPGPVDASATKPADTVAANPVDASAAKPADAVAANPVDTSGAKPADAVALPISLIDPPEDLPRFIQRPGPGEFASLYPHGAADMGMSGRAVVRCKIDHGGHLEKCAVASEAPLGLGFGGAAMSLSKYYRVDPTSEVAKRGDLELPIGFATSGNGDAQLVTGSWLRAPTFADVGAAYPDIGGGATGIVVLRCTLLHDGSIRTCKTLYEQPLNRDFDIAAQKLVHIFRMQIDPAVLSSRQPLAANVLMRIAAPFGDEGKERRIADPDWLATPNFAKLAELYPAQAAAKTVTEGTGEVDCTVAADGSLSDCHAFGDGDPAGVGFSQAALKAVVGMRMSPWTNAGGPVDGALVRLPIRFVSIAQ